jgi:deoxyribodipyrimidine photolyase-related protein
MKIFIILPTQLFENIEYLDEMDAIYIIEDEFYFTYKKFHKQKLILHRASMKYYYDKLKEKYNNKQIKYIEYDKIDYNEILLNEIYMYDPTDIPVIRKYKNAKKLIIYNTLSFLETREELEEYRNKNTNKKNYYHDRSFYKWQRKRLNILMNKDKKTPINGKWSYDKENRNPYDKKYKEDKIRIYNNKYIEEAKEYVKIKFKNNFGIIGDDFYYPITHEDAISHLETFIEYRLETFGKYQDGISKNVIFGSHSVLSPILNIGLITPEIIIREVIKYYNINNNIITVESFIRQLIGWRSYVRFMYIYHGEDMLKMNKLNHKNKLTNSWYKGTTDIGIVNDMILKVKKYAYLHHIERLMVMGNIGLLLQINPKELYDWFMICFIDSYEWVMVPNVYGMSQYALTDISMMTKPYFSSSNYIKKMSDYKKEDWFDKWNSLYWNLIKEHAGIFRKIYSLAYQVKILESKK